MTITVLLKDDLGFQEIPDFFLDELIAGGRVKAFLRSDGWAVIGEHPIRSRRSANYEAAERRARRKKACLLCPDMNGGKCVSKICPDRYKSAKLFRAF